MKKSTLARLFLMLLPMAAVGLATTANSVTVFDTQTGQAAYHSYFTLVEVGALPMAAPTAAMLSLVSGILAAVYLGAKKQGCLKAIVWTGFLAGTFAVLPILANGQTKVVPNVLLPIMMLVEAGLAYTMSKKPQTVEPAEAPRLKIH